MRTLEKKILLILGAVVIISLVVLGILNIINSEEEEYTVDYELIPLQSENRFMTISSVLDSYVTSVKYGKRDNLMLILDKKYVEENAINSSNVLDIIENYDEDYITDVREVYQVNHYNNIYMYYVRAKLVSEEFDSFYQTYIKDVYYKITLNENTLAFAVAPLTQAEYLSKVGENNE